MLNIYVLCVSGVRFNYHHTEKKVKEVIKTSIDIAEVSRVDWLGNLMTLLYVFVLLFPIEI